MEDKSKYFVVKQKAVPEVLLKVVEAKKLLETVRAITVQEAADRVVQMDDRQGLLSDLLHVVAVYRANILTIHQSIPVNGVATLTLSVEVREDTGNVSSMIDELEVLDGIHYVKILARE